MNRAVFCIAETRAQAGEIVDRLRVAGFARDDISVLMPDTSGTRDFAHKHSTKAPEGAVTGAGAGGVAGGALGYLVGAGALTIPGVGPILAAGPILAVLSGVAVGGALGGLTGSLVGMGIPEYEAKRYAGKVTEGNILMSVHADSRERVRLARAVFKEAGARDISSAGEEKGEEEAGTSQLRRRS